MGGDWFRPEGGREGERERERLRKRDRYVKSEGGGEESRSECMSPLELVALSVGGRKREIVISGGFHRR